MEVAETPVRPYDPAMDAAILAVGSELLGPIRLDTNSLRLTAVLERYGVELRRKAVVGDQLETLAGELQRLAAGHDLVLVTGGLGPTADDLTRQAVALAFGRQLTEDPALVEHLERRFAKFGRPMPAVNRRQGERIEGGRLIDNSCGSAPGWQLETERATVFLFPGVPSEAEAMVANALEPWLAERSSPDAAVERRMVKIAGSVESDIEQCLAPLYERFGSDAVAVLASPGEVRVEVRASGPAAARRRQLDAMGAVLEELLGQRAFTRRPEQSLEEVVAELLIGGRQTLTTAESCSGGLVAERLTRVAGSSAFFLGGVVAYSYGMKTALLGISPTLMERYGAVSEQVCRALASGVRERYGSDFGIGITGIAGPGGATAEKPVGTVHIALAGPGSGDLEHQQLRLAGDRQRVRWNTSQSVLERLRLRLLALAD